VVDELWPAEPISRLYLDGLARKPTGRGDAGQLGRPPPNNPGVMYLRDPGRIKSSSVTEITVYSGRCFSGGATSHRGLNNGCDMP